MMKMSITNVYFQYCLLCIDFTKINPLGDVKENFLVLPDVFSKLSQALVAPNQKVIIVVKVITHRWFYVYCTLACIDSDKSHCFENAIMGHLYSM